MNSVSHDRERLSAFFSDHQNIVVLTGAGISAGSGIPTYRDGQGRWLHSEPIQHQGFLADALQRKRYWARSMRGWPLIRDAAPNPAHQALAALELAGRVSRVITQNVDRLHQQAGSRNVIDLHGRLDRVRCLDCQRYLCRNEVQDQLERLNPPGAFTAPATPRPDGDADFEDERVQAVRVPQCKVCGGLLMPDVVFFGGTVPRERVAACMAAVDSAHALLVIGSSLQVFSGFRFCRRAAERDIPVGIINPGVTRADDLAMMKLSANCAELLDNLAASCCPASVPDSPS